MGFNYSMVRRSVFYSKQRHKTVLPKYLLLVLVSGSVSYAGIRLLSAKLGINPVSAKLMVETVLFFANFAVQRIFIFKPQSSRRRNRLRHQHEARTFQSRVAGGPPASPAQWGAWLIFLVFLGALGLEVYGFRTGHLFSQHIWEPVGLYRLARFGGEYFWRSPRRFF